MQQQQRHLKLDSTLQSSDWSERGEQELWPALSRRKAIQYRVQHAGRGVEEVLKESQGGGHAITAGRDGHRAGHHKWKQEEKSLCHPSKTHAFFYVLTRPGKPQIWRKICRLMQIGVHLKCHCLPALNVFYYVKCRELFIELNLFKFTNSLWLCARGFS